MTRVSVVLPVRNAQATIARAVGDILGQTLRDLELIVVNDGSTDGTAAILDGFTDPRLRVVHAPPRGIVASMNHALSLSRSPFVARMDGDDGCDPKRLQRSVETLEAEPDLCGVGTQVTLFREDAPISPNLQLYAQWLNSLTTPEALFADRFVESPLCHPSLTLRREAYDFAGGYRDGAFAEDWDLLLRLLESGRKLRCLAEPLFHWRDHDQRLTRTDPRYGPEAHLDLKARFLKPLLKAPVTLWGATDTGRGLAKRLGHVDRFVEVSAKKIGNVIHGAPVVSPEALGAPEGHLIAAVGAKGARAEIRAFLTARGWVEGRDFTCAA